MFSILVLHGPNLNLLGKREPSLYGGKTLAEIDQRLIREGASLGLDVRCRQTNLEGEMIEQLHECMEHTAGVLINAAGYTHTSVALRDAIAAINLPVIEVHLTNTQRREPFRHRSLIAPVCIGSIAGFGEDSYRLGLQALAWHIQKTRNVSEEHDAQSTY
jgi:3-dehydroquinate dehydratase II